MKKFLLSLLAAAIGVIVAAALAVTIVSCSQERTTVDENGFSMVPIRLKSGIAQTKAVIEVGSNFTVQVAGWEAAVAPDYNAERTWITTAPVQAAQTTQGITLANPQYYSADATIKTYMKAWHPVGTLAAGKVSFTDASDGTVDVLLAPQVSGDKDDASGKTLAFAHPLSQFIFKVVKGNKMTTTPTLTSITIRGAELPTGLDLTTDEVTYAAPADLTVPGITAGDITLDAVAQTAGVPVMVRPFTGNTFQVSVTTSEYTYSDTTITIDDDLNFLPGKAYTITLTFGERTEITLSATVTPWVEGTGSGVIE